MSNNTKKYLVGLCHYIDCIFTLSFLEEERMNEDLGFILANMQYLEDLSKKGYRFKALPILRAGCKSLPYAQWQLFLWV